MASEEQAKVVITWYEDETGRVGCKICQKAIDGVGLAVCPVCCQPALKPDAETVALVRRLRHALSDARYPSKVANAADAWLAAHEPPTIVSNGQYMPFRLDGEQVFMLPSGLPFIIPRGGYVYVTDRWPYDAKDMCIAIQRGQEDQKQMEWWMHIPPVERREPCASEHAETKDGHRRRHDGYCTPNGTRCEKYRGRAWLQDEWWEYCPKCGGKLRKE